LKRGGAYGQWLIADFADFVRRGVVHVYAYPLPALIRLDLQVPATPWRRDKTAGLAYASDAT
jgi:hypothetical protein